MAPDLTKMRVAQAARVPVAPAQVVAALEADEAAKNLTAGKVEEILKEWEERGVLESFGEEEVRYVHASLFQTDIDRRIVAALGRPRTVESLQAELRRDPLVGPIPVRDLGKMLKRLAEKRLVRNLGQAKDGKDLAAAVKEDGEVPDLHPESAEILAERLVDPSTIPVTDARRGRSWQLDGDQWYMTTLARDALQVI